MLLLISTNLLIWLVIAWPSLQRLRLSLPEELQFLAQPQKTSSSIPTVVEAPIPPTITSRPSATATNILISTSLPEINEDLSQAYIVISLNLDRNFNLYAYQPIHDTGQQKIELIELTSSQSDNINPAIRPGSTELAFASNRSGYWDIYVLDILSKELTRLTESKEYEASPSWSPDGLWIAYEAYLDANLEIVIQSANDIESKINLTNHIAADHSPAWSPDGRRIGFISSRSGSNQVWLADLDKPADDRFSCICQYDTTNIGHPAWSYDGRYLAWAAVTNEGQHNIYLWDSEYPSRAPRAAGTGDWPSWSPRENAILTEVKTSNQTYLTAYDIDQSLSMLLPPIYLPGSINGIAWADTELSADYLTGVSSVAIPSDLSILLDGEPADDRHNLIPLDDVRAPYPRLQELVVDSFYQFRSELSSKVGWDLLTDLENAFVPLTSVLPPGMQEDWLYTGRAFAFNTAPINADWIFIAREDHGYQTFWRVYLLARQQDGSQGIPLHQLPWNFDQRFRGDPQAYEDGGSYLSVIPDGYWLDFTELAKSFGWERLPALFSWRAALRAARVNEFVKTSGLDWKNAMLEIYPLEVIEASQSGGLITLTPSPTSLTTTPQPTITVTPSGN